MSKRKLEHSDIIMKKSKEKIEDIESDDTKSPDTKLEQIKLNLQRGIENKRRYYDLCIEHNIKRKELLELKDKNIHKVNKKFDDELDKYRKNMKYELNVKKNNQKKIIEDEYTSKLNEMTNTYEKQNDDNVYNNKLLQHYKDWVVVVKYKVGYFRLSFGTPQFEFRMPDELTVNRDKPVLFNIDENYIDCYKDNVKFCSFDQDNIKSMELNVPCFDFDQYVNDNGYVLEEYLELFFAHVDEGSYLVDSFTPCIEYRYHKAPVLLKPVSAKLKRINPAQNVKSDFTTSS